MSSDRPSTPPLIGHRGAARLLATVAPHRRARIRKIMIGGPVLFPGIEARAGELAPTVERTYVSAFCEECQNTVLAVPLLNPSPTEDGRALCPDCGPRAWTMHDRLVPIDPMTLEA